MTQEKHEITNGKSFMSPLPAESGRNLEGLEHVYFPFLQPKDIL